MRILLAFLLSIGLLGAASCALFKKKTKPQAVIDIPLEGVAKYLGDPTRAVVLLVLGEDKRTTQSLLDRGYNLIQVIDESNQAEFRSGFAEYSDARLRLTDFMQGKMGEDIPYKGIIMDDSQLGRPVGIPQNRAMVDLIWTRLEKGSSLFYFDYTKAASQYGKKPSSFKQAEITDLMRSKFNQFHIDSLSIPGIYVLKFTK